MYPNQVIMITPAQKAQIIIDIKGVPKPLSDEEIKELHRGTLSAERVYPAKLAKESGTSEVTVARVAAVLSIHKDYYECKKSSVPGDTGLVAPQEV